MPPNDTEMWQADREESMRRRARNREGSAGILWQAGIAFDARNDGAHLIVHGPAHTTDFWPGTGKYIRRSDGRTGRGVRNLLKLLKAEGGQDDGQE